MTVSPVSAVGFTPYVAPTADATRTAAAGGSGFGDFLLDGLNRLEGLTDASDSLAVKAATGDLQSIHDYTIAAAETSTATQLTVAVRNKAIDAFNEIMRMQV